MNDINVAFYAKVKTKFYCHPIPDFCEFVNCNTGWGQPKYKQLNVNYEKSIAPN